eukprot:TRINITY_DN5746_c0_g1_i16.p1 TRINITY_DN5746_c0_g1~~TRINITY_DN5746_c0_g1_i16.p1  ORF type:complete len:176 (-),score=18.92 TRINITY_DN5746_c0_g1_i16:264-791(-)
MDFRYTLSVELWDSNTVTAHSFMGVKLIPPNSVESGANCYPMIMVVACEVPPCITLDLSWVQAEESSTFDWQSLKQSVDTAVQESRSLYVVLEGGGAKGLAYVGAFSVLEERNLRVSHVLGTSAGAITALAVAIGMDSTELLAALDERIDDKAVFSCFLDKPVNLMSVSICHHQF